VVVLVVVVAATAVVVRRVEDAPADLGRAGARGRRPPGTAAAVGDDADADAAVRDAERHPPPSIVAPPPAPAAMAADVAADIAIVVAVVWNIGGEAVERSAADCGMMVLR
jgi:hypothetical protein